MKNLMLYNWPKLAEHFDLEGIFPQMYAVEWLMTIYVRSFDLNIASKIWDLMFLEGDFVLIKVAISILKIYEKKLLTLDFEGIVR